MGVTVPGDDMYSRISHYVIPGPLRLTSFECRALLYRHRNCTAGDGGTAQSCGARGQLARIRIDSGWCWPIPPADQQTTGPAATAVPAADRRWALLRRVSPDPFEPRSRR
ncbi:hypothetical protein HLB23_35625 [Nocardia uniformis]|uniref:Uncharacterized protein n=1 Tax=Nocardia uniformis TaxID=53432 RepID=A0A849C8J5_9NOCA|nr:hypothetical protein [Nocardia uniformis]NNH75123.1 hypothetical protein [Nocardia uniformis]